LQEYYGTDKLSSENIKVIIDVGANIGEFGLFFLEREGNVQDTFCLFVEPDSIEFNVLSRNILGKNALALNVGLWKENGTLTLYHDNHGGNSSLIEPPNFDYKSSISVKKLDTIIEDIPELQEDIDLIKIEAEGAEPEILFGSEKTLKRVRYVVVDCGPERGLKQESTLVPVIEFMYEHGFSLINFIPGRYSLLFKRNAS
jgi:FkbM family methyltransferase